jgi:hypothetical protein
MGYNFLFENFSKIQSGALGCQLGFLKNIHIAITVKPLDRSNLNLVGIFIPPRAIIFDIQIFLKSDMVALGRHLGF